LRQGDLSVGEASASRRDRSALVVRIRDVLAEFERDGYLIIEDALDASMVRRLRAAVDRVWVQEAPDGAALHRLAFVGLDDAFIELVDHPATLPIVCAALGANIYLYHCHLDVHPPSAARSDQWRWHQDGGRQNSELESPRPRLSVKVAYFLSDVPSEGHGALRVLPGSHHSDSLPREHQPADAVPLLVAAGTAVVFDRRLWHARADNHSNRTRRAIFYAYTYRWIRPRDELALDPSRLASMSPIRRQLFGASSSVIGHWIPGDDDTPLAQASKPSTS
jgi:ectoine hydroxylase-related dioxygenase (phytanoyl-CoA dioxygenase family)